MEGELLAGRYRMVRRLDSGGMGEVWFCHDERIGRDVAVKLLRDVRPSNEILSRFDREARTAGALASPRIVTVFDYGHGDYDGRTVPYIVMELLTGRTVAQVLAEEEVVELEMALRWGTQVCEALEQAHRAGVIHRDIKPGNVMILEDGNAKVLDFGIARFLETQMVNNAFTATGVFVGTAEYMSPEQVKGARLDGRTDLYALGCLLHALVSGAPPFTGDSFAALAYQHVHMTAPLPSSRRAGVPPELDALVMGLLAKEPEERPADASVALARLREVAGIVAAVGAAGEAASSGATGMSAGAAAEAGSSARAAAAADASAAGAAREATSSGEAADAGAASSESPTHQAEVSDPLTTGPWLAELPPPDDHAVLGRDPARAGAGAGSGTGSGAVVPPTVEQAGPSRRTLLTVGAVGLAGAAIGGGIAALFVGNRGGSSSNTGAAVAATGSAKSSQPSSTASATVGVPAIATITGHTKAVLGVTFSHDGKYLITSSADYLAKLWSMADPAAPTQTAQLAGHTDGVFCSAFSPDDKLVATGSSDHTTLLFRLSDPNNPAPIGTVETTTPATLLKGHKNYVVGVTFDPAGRYLATASHDSTSRLYDVSDPASPSLAATLTNPKGIRVDDPNAPDHDAMRWCTFTPDGKILITCGTLGTATSTDHVVRLWDVGDPAHPGVLAELDNSIGGTWCVAVSPDGKTMVTTGEDHNVRLWAIDDPHNPSLLATLQGHTDVIQTCAFSHDGHTVASGSRDTTIRLWDAANRSVPKAGPVLKGHTDRVLAVTFSPDGKLLASCGQDVTARIWKVA